MVKIVPLHSQISEEEEFALLEKAKAKGIYGKKEAARLAIQHFIQCDSDISEPNALYAKLKKKIETK